jgi:hypothetical integral membrane protein (TIGR02206 family)
LIPLALIALSMPAMMWLGQKLPPPARVWPARLLGLGIALYAGTAYYERFRDGGWAAIATALPLHLCDLAVLICLWAVLSASPFAFELAYYWGLAGALQAVLQPDITDGLGFPSWYYFEYWLGHGLIFTSVFYLMGAFGLRPRPGSLLRVILLVNVWILAVGCLDYLFSWNYGYLCHKPQGASLLDHMGPWPVYVLGAAVLAALNFWLLWLPFRGQGAEPVTRNSTESEME